MPLLVRTLILEPKQLRSQESGWIAWQDKGVTVKEYWVEKLKPGEEDKALSTMITEFFSKPNGEKTEEVPNGGGGRNISQIVSDAVHKREPEESEKHKPMTLADKDLEFAGARKRLFQMMINELSTVFEVVTGCDKQSKDSARSNGNKSKSNGTRLLQELLALCDDTMKV
ncbi:hypothetical protein ACET3Z_021794 [Daucus carota]